MLGNLRRALQHAYVDATTDSSQPESPGAYLLNRVKAAIRPILPARFRSDLPLVPVVRLTGIIGFSSPLRPGITLSGVSKMLERAFTMPNARAVALLINSPGGSPVQSHLIFRRIRQLAAEHHLPVLAFVEDVGCVRRLHDRLRGGRDHL